MGVSMSTATAAIAKDDATGLSNAMNVGAKVICGLQMPAAWTAADLTFQISIDDGATWVNLLDDQRKEVTVSGPGAGEYLALDPSTFAGVQFVKLRSGTAAVPVAQAAARSLIVVSRKFYALN